MLITLYIFSVVGFIVFQDHYEGPDETADYATYCHDLFNCYASTVNLGLRMGGGIGDGIRKTVWEDDLYASRVVFDIFFFIWISVILLNVVFGIIIDTFGERRDERKEANAMINNQCFICGETRGNLEASGNAQGSKKKGWSYHFMCKH